MRPFSQRVIRSPGASLAFSLIELLVVMAVVAILASLIAGRLSRTKSMARSTACKSNLRQLGLALQMYVDDSKAYPGLGEQRVSWWLHTWPGKLLPYASSETGVFNCPASSKAWHWSRNPSSYGFDFPWNIDVLTPLSYGYNATLWGLGGFAEVDSVRQADVVAPMDMITLGDSSGDPHIQYHASSSRFGRKILGPPGTGHSAGANIVFADGHVEWRKQTNWIRRSDPVAKQWHRDNQPHREVW
jgi:prepilin-type processing-associated H-X9-DG protein/prepilin-type N-terminal cleavage/methylation domain-containing protein